MAMEMETKMEIELMKKDVHLLTSLFTKFDSTIEKLQEIESSLSKMISLQEMRMDAQETASKEIFNILEVRRMDHTSDIKEMNGRIDSVSKELTNKILQELQELRKELKTEKDLFANRINVLEIAEHSITAIVAFLAFMLASASDFMGLFK